MLVGLESISGDHQESRAGIDDARCGIQDGSPVLAVRDSLVDAPVAGRRRSLREGNIIDCSRELGAVRAAKGQFAVDGVRRGRGYVGDPDGLRGDGPLAQQVIGDGGDAARRDHGSCMCVLACEKVHYF